MLNYQRVTVCHGIDDPQKQMVYLLIARWISFHGKVCCCFIELDNMRSIISITVIIFDPLKHFFFDILNLHETHCHGNGTSCHSCHENPPAADFGIILGGSLKQSLRLGFQRFSCGSWTFNDFVIAMLVTWVCLKRIQQPIPFHGFNMFQQYLNMFKQFQDVYSLTFPTGYSHQLSLSQPRRDPRNNSVTLSGLPQWPSPSFHRLKR